MITHQDPASSVLLHHNGDFSGFALLVIPLKGAPPEATQDQAIEFDVEDPESPLGYWMAPDRYGMDYYCDRGQWYMRLSLPGMVFARFGAEATLSAVTSMLEQTNASDLLRG